MESTVRLSDPGWNTLSSCYFYSKPYGTLFSAQALTGVVRMMEAYTWRQTGCKKIIGLGQTTISLSVVRLVHAKHLHSLGEV